MYYTHSSMSTNIIKLESVFGKATLSQELLIRSEKNIFVSVSLLVKIFNLHHSTIQVGSSLWAKGKSPSLSSATQRASTQCLEKFGEK